MSGDPDSVPCECGHMRGIHKARDPRECATAGCGCGRFRVRAPGSSPEPPRAAPGRVERELPPGTPSTPASPSVPAAATDAISRFGRHLRGRLRALGWDAAALAERSGLSAHVTGRAVNGTSVDLATAEKIADLVGSALLAMIGPYRCGTCDGEPPAGFRCLECGTEANGARR